ncbi:uncharacterized protein LOC112464636 [Temnothorax curvispinosus]|uniref:Uncharacterized protein LOC112464636 n=1 Tax=Temnothorax curvispinosus TaxID=300111 RepID=A0A6J1R376_9HYME|nr:uncharacterized protein LOC112464636 [Temnothorax curvispinosus]
MNSGSTSQSPVVVGGGYTLERLEGTKNYNNWKFTMKMSLIMDGLWNCVLGTDNDAIRDQRALAKICLNVQSACYAYVREANTSKQAWDNLQAAFEVQQLADIGHKVNDEEVAMLLLGGLPAEFDPLVMGIEVTHERFVY